MYVKNHACIYETLASKHGRINYNTRLTCKIIYCEMNGNLQVTIAEETKHVIKGNLFIIYIRPIIIHAMYKYPNTRINDRHITHLQFE